MRRKKSEDLPVFLSECQRLVVLEDIENPTNVGAIFRSAAALGADGVLLTKGSSDPLYRRAARVSMGTVFSIRWCFLSCDHMAILKDHGFYTIAMALSEHAVDLDRNTLPVTSKRAVILGNEDHGVSGNTLDACDIVVKIPMAEGVDSLNVSAAAAVACWEVFH